MYNDIDWIVPEHHSPMNLETYNNPLYASTRIQFRMKCYPLIMYEIIDLEDEEKIKLMECSNKIIAPSSIIQKLCQYGNIVSEYTFQIHNKKNRVTIAEYYNYNPNSGLEPDAIYIPSYIFEGLDIEYGQDVSFNFINETLPKGDYIRIQPETNKIMQIDNYQIYLQEHLQKHYTCLIKGETIKIPYFDDVINLIIHDIKPNDIVSITDVDLTVDFEPSLEQKEIEKQQEELLEAEKKRIEEMQEEQKKREVAATFDPKKMRFHRPNQNINIDEEQEKPEPFQSFGGQGNILGSINNNTTINPAKEREEMRLKRLKFLEDKIEKEKHEKEKHQKETQNPVTNVKPNIKPNAKTNAKSNVKPNTKSNAKSKVKKIDGINVDDIVPVIDIEPPHNLMNITPDSIKELDKITNKKNKPKFKLRLKKKSTRLDSTKLASKNDSKD